MLVLYVILAIAMTKPTANTKLKPNALYRARHTPYALYLCSSGIGVSGNLISPQRVAAAATRSHLVVEGFS
jgi:hypothetical protein